MDVKALELWECVMCLRHIFMYILRKIAILNFSILIFCTSLLVDESCFVFCYAATSVTADCQLRVNCLYVNMELT